MVRCLQAVTTPKALLIVASLLVPVLVSVSVVVSNRKQSDRAATRGGGTGAGAAGAAGGVIAGGASNSSVYGHQQPSPTSTSTTSTTTSTLTTSWSSPSSQICHVRKVGILIADGTGTRVIKDIESFECTFVRTNLTQNAIQVISNDTSTSTSTGNDGMAANSRIKGFQPPTATTTTSITVHESDTDFCVLELPDSVIQDNQHLLQNDEWFIQYDPSWLQTTQSQQQAQSQAQAQQEEDEPLNSSLTAKAKAKSQDESSLFSAPVMQIPEHQKPVTLSVEQVQQTLSELYGRQHRALKELIENDSALTLQIENLTKRRFSSQYHRRRTQPHPHRSLADAGGNRETLPPGVEPDPMPINPVTNGKVLIVRVSTADGQPQFDANQIQSILMGTQPGSFASQTFACSVGAATLTLYDPSTPVFEVTVPGTASSYNFNGLFLAANPTVKEHYGVNSLEELVEFAIFVAPQGLGAPAGTPSGSNIVAYAGYRHFKSVIVDSWINTTMVVLHETGHNRNLGHAYDNDVEYQDLTNCMGATLLDTQFICFNGVSYDYLGWFRSDPTKVNGTLITEPTRNGRELTIPWPSAGVTGTQAGLNTAPTVYDLAFYGDFQLQPDASASPPMLIKVSKYYLVYNRKKGSNAQTVEYPDRLVVHTFRNTGIAVGSNLITNLGVGDQPYYDSQNNLYIAVCEEIAGDSVSTMDSLKVAVGDTSEGLCATTTVTVAPTSPPTLPPTTAAPTTPKPTSPPTLPPTTAAPTTPAPTNPPTLPPTTAAPTTPVTPAPTNPPTFPPTTAAPTTPITPVPTNPPTFPPTTAAPITPVTPAPTNPPTFPPTTAAPITPVPTNPPTLAPTTAAPITTTPTSLPTLLSTTATQTTLMPTGPATLPPTTASPTTLTPTSSPTLTSTTAALTTLTPTSLPTTAAPTTRTPTTSAPTTKKPTTSKPTTKKPTTSKPTTKKPTTSKPTTKKPTTPKPTMVMPTQKPALPGKNATRQPTQAPTTPATCNNSASLVINIGSGEEIFDRDCRWIGSYNNAIYCAGNDAFTGQRVASICQRECSQFSGCPVPKRVRRTRRAQLVIINE